MIVGPVRSEAKRSELMADHDPILLGDIGGTHVRLAIYAGARLGPVERLDVAAYADLPQAVAAFVSRQARRDRITSAFLAVAGPVENGRCENVNSGWVIDAQTVQSCSGFASVRLLNDFEAIAWSLRRLAPNDILTIGGGHAQPNAPMVVTGAGTGFGIAAFLPDEGGLVIPSEGGHANLPANSDREDAVIGLLRRQFGRVSAERALSGPGLQNLYRAIAELDRADVSDRSAAEITRAALAGTCPVSKAALDMFCAMLGTVAGDLALLFRARGGVCLAGGIVPRIAHYLAHSEFRARFEGKGRVRAYLEAIPTSVIVHSDPAFVGLISIIESERGIPFAPR
jgi:glucokinase